MCCSWHAVVQQKAHLADAAESPCADATHDEILDYCRLPYQPFIACAFRSHLARRINNIAFPPSHQTPIPPNYFSHACRMTHSDDSFVYPVCFALLLLRRRFSSSRGASTIDDTRQPTWYINKQQCKSGPQQQAPFFGHDDPIAPFVAVAMGLQVLTSCGDGWQNDESYCSKKI